jgi:hypothetical protein
MTHHPFSEWNSITRSPLVGTIKELCMPSSQLKRAERAIQAIRDQAELPPEAADALEELVDVVGTMETAWPRWKVRVVLTQPRRWTYQIGIEIRHDAVAMSTAEKMKTP